MNIFFSVLTKESGKDEEFLNLYKDSISFYVKEPKFAFLVNIFVKIFNNFDLCKLLFKEFKKILKKS